MADEIKMELAKKTYDTLCATIDNKGWKYKKEEERLMVYFTVTGEDLPMEMYMIVDPERQLIRLMSPMPFKMSQDKIIDGAIATCVASFGMVNGNFDYDISTGEIEFRVTASFRDSAIGEELFWRMIMFSCQKVDEYNDKFLAINKGFMSIDTFIDENMT